MHQTSGRIKRKFDYRISSFRVGYKNIFSILKQAFYLTAAPLLDSPPALTTIDLLIRLLAHLLACSLNSHAIQFLLLDWSHYHCYKLLPIVKRNIYLLDQSHVKESRIKPLRGRFVFSSLSNFRVTL